LKPAVTSKPKVNFIARPRKHCGMLISILKKESSGGGLWLVYEFGSEDPACIGTEAKELVKAMQAFEQGVLRLEGNTLTEANAALSSGNFTLSTDQLQQIAVLIKPLTDTCESKVHRIVNAHRCPCPSCPQMVRLPWISKSSTVCKGMGGGTMVLPQVDCCTCDEAML
jgi:hypothetical protein